MPSEKTPHTLDPILLEYFREAQKGSAKLEQLRELLRRKVIAAMATGVATDKLSIVLLTAVHGKFADAQKYLEESGCLPSNASLLQGPGSFGVDFVICGWLPKGWAAENFAQRSELFRAYHRYEATRNYRYKGRKFLELLPNVSLARADSDMTLERFYEATRDDTRIWICDPSTVPVCTFMGFIQRNTKSQPPKRWLEIAREVDALEPLQDLFEVVTDIQDTSTPDGTIPGYFKSFNFVAIGQYQYILGEGDAYSYTNSLSQINRWRNIVSSNDLATAIAVIEMVSIIESHEQYTEKSDIASRLGKYQRKENFAYAGDEDGSNDDGPFDLPLPLWNTVILGTTGSRKTPLVAHVVRAFLQHEPYDVVYVNCKNAHEHLEYKDGPMETNEIWLFDDLVNQLAGVQTVPVRVDDIGEALRQKPIDASRGRSFYTELIKTSGSSAMNQLQHNTPGQSERHGRNLLVIFDELLNYARKVNQDDSSLDPHPFKYPDNIKVEARTGGKHYVIISQEIAHFDLDAGETIPESHLMKGLLIGCNVIMGRQDGHESNKLSYEQLLSDRRQPAEYPPAWSIDFERVSKLDVPTGPFLLFAKDYENSSFPVPGRVRQIDAKKKKSDVKYIWKDF